MEYFLSTSSQIVNWFKTNAYVQRYGKFALTFFIGVCSSYFLFKRMIIRSPFLSRIMGFNNPAISNNEISIFLDSDSEGDMKDNKDDDTS